MLAETQLEMCGETSVHREREERIRVREREKRGSVFVDRDLLCFSDVCLSCWPSGTQQRAEPQTRSVSLPLSWRSQTSVLPVK